VDIAPADPSVIQGDITNLGHLDDSYDTVFCLDILEHLTFEQAKQAITGVRRMLEKGGHLIITSPHAENMASNTVTCPVCREKFHRSGHQQKITLSRLERLLTGFEIIKTKICNLGFMQLFGFPVDLFYRWKLEKVFPHKLLTKDIFVIAKKL